MEVKKLLVGTLGATALGAGIGGIKGVGKGLDLGIKMGFCAGMTMGVMVSTAFVLGKKKLEKKCA